MCIKGRAAPWVLSVYVEQCALDSALPLARARRAKALIIRLLPLQGVRLVWRIFTQDVALGYVLLPLRGVLFVSFDTPSYVFLPLRTLLLRRPETSATK